MAGSNLVPVDQLKIKDNQYGADGSGLPAYQRDFIQRFAPYAMLASAQSGIPARFLLAEASIETNWGQSKGAREDNNLFGIKATPSQIAAGVPVTYRDTGENAANGAAYTEKAAPFIKYSSPEAGFNGFVEKLNKTRRADQKALLKHTAENPYAQDNGVETALAGAFARTSYLTADKIDQTMLDRMARMPSDLNAAGFKTAPDFNKATTDLARLAPFDPSQAQNVSGALGAFTDNDYVSPNGIPITARPRELNALDRFSDGITEGLEGAGAAVSNTFSGFGNAIRGAFGIGAQASDAPSTPAPGPYDFANGGTPGGIGDPNFGGGVAPAPLPSLTPAPTLDAPAGTNTIADLFETVLGRPADAQTLQAFDAELDSGRMDLNAIQAALRGSPEAQTLGPLGEAKTYSPLDTIFARQFDRAPDAAAVQNWGNVNGADIGALEAQLYGSQEAQTYRAGLGDLAGLISPGVAPTIGAGPAAGTIGNGGLAGMIGADPATGTLGPTPNQSITATPGIGEYDFASNYLRANGDVAAAGMNPWEHFLRYGAQEGRAFNTAGDKFDASKYLLENADVQQAGQDALTHYLSYGAAEGRDAPIIGANGTTRDIGSLGLTPTITASLAQYLQPQGTAPTIGPQQNEFSGSFDGGEYLKANADVAQAGIDPLQHFLRYGFAEGRAINPGGAHINQAFDPSAYLQQNPDVAAAKLDPLAHFLMNGASEGRAAPTGSNPYSFSNFNVAQGAGPVGNGSFGLGGITGGQSGSLPGFGSSFNVSQNVPNGSFGTGITQDTTISPFGFTGTNPSGALGATPQNFGGAFGPSGSAPGGGDSKDNIIDPYGFGGDVSGYDVNGPNGATGGVAGERQAYWDGAAIKAGNNQASQNAFIAGELKKAADNTASGLLAGQQITNVAPGNQTNYALGAINTPIAPIQQTPFTPVNMSGVFAPMPTAPFMPRFTF